MAGDTATELKIGNKMPDGSIYAGISPDIGGAMYATPQNAPFETEAEPPTA